MHPGDLFGIRPPNRQALWDRLTDFFTAWFGPLTPKCGVSAASILRAEYELGIDLPAAVREAYLSFGARLELTRGTCRLNRIDTLCIEDDALLVWFDEDDTALWGILLEHLDRQ
jgi:cell wall assembly regulator SMI1